MDKKWKVNSASSSNFASSFENQLAQLHENEKLSGIPSVVEKRRQTWARSRPSPINPKEAILFQQIEIDEYTDILTGNPVIRLYGITETGNSVLCHIFGFLPYFYIPAPVGFKDRDLTQFQKCLEPLITIGNNPIFKIEIVLKESIWGFHGNRKNLIPKTSHRK
ncbi:hypothetical protein G9A89_020161 [Geosiphon pyriformis]|nr:hypothetical protein G9A89_020161 [Geosiphon pyriformis]